MIWFGRIGLVVFTLLGKIAMAVLPNGSSLYDHGRIYDLLAKMVVFWSSFQLKSRFSPKVGHILVAFTLLAL